jgi:hypothetical protein
MTKHNKSKKETSKSPRATRSKFPTPAKKKPVKEVYSATEELERRQRESVMHQDGPS